jgi:nitroimidazol reductase NimA-like FMN-containing flavoprotein (pyridoxamine 5'-phosphate oxidase superfamily)
MGLLSTESIGRVVLTEQAMPTAVPAAYAVDEGTIVFRTPAGAALAAASGSTVVAFEVDSIDELEHEGWSVVVTGLARAVRDPEELRRAADLAIPHWLEPGDSELIRLVPSIVSGRLIGAPQPAPHVPS